MAGKLRENRMVCMCSAAIALNDVHTTDDNKYYMKNRNSTH